jgi:uncharacterized protein YaaQ
MFVRAAFIVFHLAGEKPLRLLCQFDTPTSPVYIGTESRRKWRMTDDVFIDRVAVVTVRGDTADALAHRLDHDGFSVTRIDSSGGILLEPTSTFLIGLPQHRMPTLLEHVRNVCHTRTRWIPAQPSGTLLPALPQMIEAETGGATIVALTAERCIRL